MRWHDDCDDDDEACLIKTIKVYRNSGIQIEDHKCRAARILALALRRVARSMPRRERQILVLVSVVDGGLEMDHDRVAARDFGGNVEGHDGEHGVAAGRKQGEGRGAGRARLRISRHKKVLLLVLHPLHSLLHKVHVLAPEAQRVLPAGIEVYDPVHWHLS